MKLGTIIVNALLRRADEGVIDLPLGGPLVAV